MSFIQMMLFGKCYEKIQHQCLVTPHSKKVLPHFQMALPVFWCESIASGFVLGAIEKSLALSYLHPFLEHLHNLMSSPP